MSITTTNQFAATVALVGTLFLGGCAANDAAPAVPAPSTSTTATTSATVAPTPTSAPAAPATPTASPSSAKTPHDVLTDPIIPADDVKIGGSLDELNDYTYGLYARCMDRGDTLDDCERFARTAQANGVHDVRTHNIWLSRVGHEAFGKQEAEDEATAYATAGDKALDDEETDLVTDPGTGTDAPVAPGK